MSQTPDTVLATWDAAAGAVVGRLAPQPYGRAIQNMTWVGPPGSAFTVYRGYVIDAASVILTSVRGERATATGAGSPLTIQSGEAATFVWSGGAAAAGQTARATLVSDVTE